MKSVSTNISTSFGLLLILIFFLALVQTSTYAQENMPLELTANTPVPLDGTLGRALELRLNTEVGKFYQPQYSDGLSEWENEGYSFKGTGGNVSRLISFKEQAAAFVRVIDLGDPNNLAPTPFQRDWVSIDPVPSLGDIRLNDTGVEVEVRIDFPVDTIEGIAELQLSRSSDMSDNFVIDRVTLFAHTSPFLKGKIPPGYYYRVPTAVRPINSWHELSPLEQCLAPQIGPIGLMLEGKQGPQGEPGPQGESIGFSQPNYDSGWMRMERFTTSSPISHGLGTLPMFAIVWGAMDSSGGNMYLMDASYDRGQNVGAYGTYLQQINSNTYRLSSGELRAWPLWGHTPYFRIQETNSDTGTWIRVLMWK